MRKELISPWAIVFVAFTAGAILGRRWTGALADGVLSLIAWLTGILLMGMGVAYWRRLHRISAGGSAVQGGSIPLLSERLSATRDGDRWVLRANNIWRLRFIQVAVALPKMTAPGEAREGAGGSPARLWSRVLFVLALSVYVLSRFYALDKFPIYFFADEAIEGVLASQLIAGGMRDYQHHLLPLFFNMYGFFNPLISVYAHVVGILVFGKSVVVTRGVSVVLTVVGAVAVAGILKVGFRVRTWWAGVLFLAVTPAWFLHSRSAFETATMVSAYACFLFLYVLYRTRSPNYLFPALVLGAVTFYSYGNGQIVIGVTGLALAIVDFRYHVKNWRTSLAGGVLLLLLAWPYYRFGVEHPNEAAYHLRTLDTYLFKQIPAGDKVSQFVQQYAYGLSPQYWFIPNSTDLMRHRMKGYGNLAWWSLPFLLIGVGVCLTRLKSPAHRVILIASLAAPIGGALTQIAITRVLAFVVPASVLAGIGLEWLLDRMRRPALQNAAVGLVFMGLSVSTLGMMGDALANGPLWYRDYSLYGMQWGAEQLFKIIPEYLRSPDTVVNVTPTWANGTDVFLEYFMPNEPRVDIANVDALIADKLPLDDRMVFVMTPEELARARTSGKFKSIDVNRVVPYPDGTDGFYFVRLAYIDDIDAVFAAEKAERLKPVTEQLLLNGELVTVSHSLFDSGRLANLFDNDTYTLARVAEANPALLEFTFPTPRRLSSLSLDLGTMQVALKIVLDVEGQGPVEISRTYLDLPADPHIDVAIDQGPVLVHKIHIELSVPTRDPFKIHIRELKFNP